jgi:hypothetical protein
LIFKTPDYNRVPGSGFINILKKKLPPTLLNPIVTPNYTGTFRSFSPFALSPFLYTGSFQTLLHLFLLLHFNSSFSSSFQENLEKPYLKGDVEVADGDDEHGAREIST